MALVVVGGHTRNVGKTSVVAGLVAALAERRWLAIKITQFGHGVCAVNLESCDCAPQDHGWAISEETDRSGQSDSSRFLVAGAARALWVRSKQGMLAEALPGLRRELASAENVIIESNSVLRFLRPDLYLPVLDPASADFKESSREFLDRASAVVLHQPPQSGFTWSGVSLKPVASRPIFLIHPPQYVTPELVEFVRERLGLLETRD